MKKLLLFTTLLFACSLATYSLAPSTQAVEIDVEFDKEGSLMIFSNNKDYCDYYICVTLLDVRGYDMNRVNPYCSTVRRGENRLLTLKRLNDFPSYSYNWNYMAYRGQINPKLKLDFIYALPVSPGDTVQASTVKNLSDFTLAFDLSRAGDTIYACRSGCVCDNRLTDQTVKGNSGNNRIIIYHNDGSFSEYSNIEQSLVYPGNNVKLGQPIAINTGKILPKSVSFSVYYLDKNKVQNAETGNKHSHLIPVFHTSAGDVKMDEDGVYTGEITEFLIIQELSERARKKYEKKKEKQQKNR